MKQLTICLLLLAFSTYSNGQAISRQSINAYGGSAQINTVLIEQSAGQSHQTETVEDSEIEVRPGFIQSRTFKVEVDKETNTLEGNIYPNPAKESFKLELDESIDYAEIRISNPTGVIIEQIDINDFREVMFDSSNWGTGTHFISLLSRDGKVFKSKLIITK